MTRLIIITFINLMIPFILRGIYIYALRLIAKRKNKKGMVNITPPQYHFPVKKLILYGVLITILMFASLRIFNVDIDTSFKGNQARDEVINK